MAAVQTVGLSKASNYITVQCLMLASPIRWCKRLATWLRTREDAGSNTVDMATDRSTQSTTGANKVRKFWLAIISVVPIAYLVGCGSSPPKVPYSAPSRINEFEADIGSKMTVNIGDSFFVEGAMADRAAFDLKQPINSMMPGAMAVPFSFSIAPSKLIAKYSRGDELFYCAPMESVSASFPGLGSVIREGDCVGVREERGSGDLDWIVDNSHYNNQITVWSRSVSKDERRLLKKITVPVADKNATLTKISFDGYYSELLHFTFRKLENGDVIEREYIFDYPPKQGKAVYGIKGKLFKVIDVNNTSMTYEWVALN